MTRKTLGDWWLSKKWGYAASVALIPYAILKTLWAMGVTLLVSEKGIEELHTSTRTIAGLSFISVSVVTFYKLIVGSISLSDSPDFEPWVLIPVYGGFFIWGVTISLAALSYQIRRRSFTPPIKELPSL